MMNHYHSLTPEDIDFSTQEDADAWRVMDASPHIDRLLAEYSEIERRHAMLHMMGLDSGQAHTACLKWAEQVDGQIETARAAAWN